MLYILIHLLLYNLYIRYEYIYFFKKCVVKIIYSTCVDCILKYF